MRKFFTILILIFLGALLGAISNFLTNDSGINKWLIEFGIGVKLLILAFFL